MQITIEKQQSNKEDEYIWEDILNSPRVYGSPGSESDPKSYRILSLEDGVVLYVNRQENSIDKARAAAWSDATLVRINQPLTITFAN